MKPWRRCVLLAAALLLCLSLTACGDKPAETDSTAGYVEVPKPDVIPADGWVLSESVDYNPSAFSDEGYFFLLNCCLCFLDADTGYTVYLCSKPGCKHAESASLAALSACDAYVEGISNMMFYLDGNIYYDIQDEYGCHLYARSADGTNLREIATLGSQYFSQDTEVAVRQYAVAGGYLYYTIRVYGLVETEPDAFTSVELYNTLVRLNLSTGKEDELIRSYDEFIGLPCVNDGMVLVRMGHSFTTEELQRPDYTEYKTQFPACFRLWSEETGGLTTLCEAERELGTVIGLSDGKLHVFNQASDTGIYALDLAAGVLEKSDLPENVNRMWGERYGAVKLEGYYDLETGEYFTSVFSSLPLPAGCTRIGYSPECIGQTGVVFYEMYMTDTIVAEHNYVYVSYEDLVDGFQAEDRLIFIHGEDGAEEELIQPES